MMRIEEFIATVARLRSQTVRAKTWDERIKKIVEFRDVLDDNEAYIKNNDNLAKMRESLDWLSVALNYDSQLYDDNRICPVSDTIDQIHEVLEYFPSTKHMSEGRLYETIAETIMETNAISKKNSILITEALDSSEEFADHDVMLSIYNKIPDINSVLENVVFIASISSIDDEKMVNDNGLKTVKESEKMKNAFSIDYHDVKAKVDSLDEIESEYLSKYVTMYFSNMATSVVAQGAVIGALAQAKGGQGLSADGIPQMFLINSLFMGGNVARDMKKTFYDIDAVADKVMDTFGIIPPEIFEKHDSVDVKIMLDNVFSKNN